ncbi:hypothetical protein [Paenarthrobacter ureafaciens]|uniref:hypothetical protein n=1 Tax=Paenarthrobacter ureafaciens TaxID=37931 RepID=UPI001A98483A|nr:hypothetical protein [Paenarthrobacter ureafaciens]QSZ55648.1 hypothetical protein AYX19_21400 [Paenarthrobacter ureafaciens]
MPVDRYRSPIPPQLWDTIRNEFGLPALSQVRERLEVGSPDPEPVLRQLVRVFIDEGTFCPGFQFQPDLSLNRVVVALFQRAMELRVPHNYFALWMVTPCPALGGARPVDRRIEKHGPTLLAALGSTLARAVA